MDLSTFHGCGSYFFPVKFLRWRPKYLVSNGLPSRIPQYLPSHFLVNNRRLALVIIVLTLVSFSSSILLVVLNEINIYSSILLVGSQYAKMRNNSSLGSLPFLTASQNLSAYVSALLIGRYVIPRFLITSKLISFLLIALPSVLSVVLVALMQGQRGIVFLYFFLLIGGFILYLLEPSCIYRRFSSISSAKSFRTLIALIFVPIIFGLLLPFLSRGLVDPTGEISNVATSLSLDNPLILYSVGHIPNFLEWFDQVVMAGHHDPSYSIPFVYTFRDFVVLVFGSTDPLPPGVYDDYRYGNIYTVFRGLINDFGIFGSVLISALLGAAATLAFSLCRSTQKYFKIIGQIGCIIFFQLLFQSYGVSAFIWKSTLVLPFVYVMIDQFLLRRKNLL